jgi:hypothetical protein
MGLHARCVPQLHVLEAHCVTLSALLPVLHASAVLHVLAVLNALAVLQRDLPF